MTKTAFMIDGGHFRKHCLRKWGNLSPYDAADKVKKLCDAHLKFEGTCELYRIFYYDCRPSEKKVYHPLQRTTIDLSNSPQFVWAMNFYKELNKLKKWRSDSAGLPMIIWSILLNQLLPGIY